MAGPLSASAQEPLAPGAGISCDERLLRSGRRNTAGAGWPSRLAEGYEVPPLLFADAGPLLHRPRHLFHHLLAATVSPQGARLLPGHDREVRLGAFCFWRFRIYGGRMAFGSPDARRLDASPGAQNRYGHRRVPVAV